MAVTNWTCSLPSGEASEELAVQFDQRREHRLLILPALFDEANKLRRQTAQVMRALDKESIDSFLPDLPGMNESLAPFCNQTLTGWQSAAKAAANAFDATHVLTWRAGALIAPTDLPGWRYAQTSGTKQLRSMMRARTISSREAGKEEKLADLQVLARSKGIELAGWQLSAEMFVELENATPAASEIQTEIAQADIGGAGLWLRAEPDEDTEQAQTLAAIISRTLHASDIPESSPE